MTTIPSPVGGALALALRRLSDGVHALVDPTPEWVGGTCRWSDPLYARVRGALQARTMRAARTARRSRLPCHADALAWLVGVDQAVAAWTADEGKGDTTDRLHALLDYGWRPQDCSLLEDYTAQLERWALAASEMLGDLIVTVPLRFPCPACGRRFVYRRNIDGEHTRFDALRVSEDGAECSGCRASWAPAEFHWLARLLGCDPLPA